MPVGARSRRPGETTVAWRASPPARGGGDEDDEGEVRERGLERVGDSQLLGDVRADALAEVGQPRASSGTIAKPSAAASTNAQNAPP